MTDTHFFDSIRKDVFRIGAGCGFLHLDRVREHNMPKAAMAAGINLFDTADCYGDGFSESHLGDFFPDADRERIVVCTKYGQVNHPDGPSKDFSIERIDKAIAQSCDRMKIDYLDILFLHDPAEEDVLEGKYTEHWAHLDRLVTKGTLRTYGISTDSPDAAMRFLDQSNGRALELLLNLACQPARRCIPTIEQKGALALIKSPLGLGTFTDRFSSDWPPKDDPRRMHLWSDEIFAARVALVDKVRPILTQSQRTCSQGALAWLLTLSPNLVPIPGLSTPKQLAENVQAGSMRLSQDEMRALDAIDDGAILDLNMGW